MTMRRTSLWTTGHLADDLYFMLHDDYSGRPRLPERIIGLGLAAALLGELDMHGLICVTTSNIILSGWTPPEEGEKPLDSVVSQLLAEMQHDRQWRPVRDWLEYLGQDAATRVARRLESNRLLYLKRATWWSASRWTPLNP